MKKISVILAFFLLVSVFLFQTSNSVLSVSVNCLPGYHWVDTDKDGLYDDDECKQNGTDPETVGCKNDSECSSGYSCTDKINYGTYTGTCTRNPDPTNSPALTLPPPHSGIFVDVAPSYWAFTSIENLYKAGMVYGCYVSPLKYCPEDMFTRAQMAVILLRVKYGASYSPPDVGSSTGFTDVPTGYWAAAWIKQLVADGITSGCATGKYCPDDLITRAQMAVFILRIKHNSGYSPPAVGTTTGFTDVPTGYWAAAWIKQLATEGISVSCTATTYCPDGSVSRALAAVMIGRAFNITTSTPTPTTQAPTVTPILATATPVPGCPKKSQGDANCDDIVNGKDYSYWLNRQCTTGCTAASLVADFNSDNKVDDSDYTIWLNNHAQ